MARSFHVVTFHLSNHLYDAMRREADASGMALARLVRIKLGDVPPTRARKPEQTQKRLTLTDDIDIDSLTDADLDALMG